MDTGDVDTQEEYKSPFDFSLGVNQDYLYLSPSTNVFSPGSPSVKKGLLGGEPIPEVGEDAAATATLQSGITDEEREELTNELAKVEEEIQTLSQVLAAKEKHVAELKKKLGMTPLNEFRQNLSRSWLDVQSSTAFKKTSETLTQAGQKASSAFSNFGFAISRKLEDVRNSPAFKSFEERVENLKFKTSTNKDGGGDFGEVLNSAACASATETITEEKASDQEAD
ncbi:tumor protein D52 isoform X2 [Callorhinchus milii]|uniref:Tumor protein D52 n=1 Tax=Callorhinchus milii TaxID=7868 RepID=A0A4W3GHN6_CALMI|nr:tumor protein D52 isoform X2 [Callorhinchus milii]